MTVHAPPDKVTKDDVEAFVNSCVKLRSHYEHYLVLFRRGDLRLDLLRETAHVFFRDLNDLLITALIGSICRLTDPQGSGARKNLTVEFLVKNSDFVPGSKEALRVDELSIALHEFRAKLLPARHKRIAHHDRAAALSSEFLGAASDDEWAQFWLDLQEFVKIFHTRYIDGKGHFNLNGIAQLTDAELLVKAMRESTFFRGMIEDHALTQKCADVAFGSKYSDA